MFQRNSWSRNALIALVLSYIAIIPMAVVLFTSPIPIDTDLRSLSPEFTKIEGLKSLIDDSASVAEKRIQFVLVSGSEYQLEDALVELEDALLEFDKLSEPNFDQVLLEYSELLKRHPRNFVTLRDAERLQTASNSDLLAARLQSMYGAGGGVSMIPIQDDPLGLLNNVLMSVLEKIQPSVEDELDEGLYVEGVTFDIFGTSSMAEQKALVDKLTAVIDELVSRYSDVTIYQSGVLFFAEEAARNSKRDISFISTASIVATVILLLSIFRSIRPMLLPVVSIASGVLTAFVLCTWLFNGIHILTIVFGASLVGVVVDYSLHYFYFRCSQKTKQEFSGVYRALFFSLFTSVIGYAALSFSGLPVLKQVAVFSIVGLSASWLVVVAFGEYLTRHNQKLYDGYLSACVNAGIEAAKKLGSRGTWFLGISTVLFSAFVFFTYKDFKDNPRLFFSFSDDRIANEEHVSKFMSSFEPASFVLVRGDSVDGLYRSIASLRENVAESNRLFGVDDVIPSQTRQYRNFELTERVYQTGVGRALFLQLGFDERKIDELLSVGAEDFSSVSVEALWQDEKVSVPRLWFEDNGHHYALFMIPKALDVATLKQSLNVSDSTQFFSTVENTEKSLRELRATATILLMLACLLIYFLVAVRYRSWRSSVIVLIPVTSIAISYSMIQSLGGVSLFHVMALFLVLGLGMDYVIFVREMSSHVDETMKAITLSCITSLMAFGLLGLSSMPVVQSFGVAVLLGNTCNLIGAFILASNVRYLGKTKHVTAL